MTVIRISGLAKRFGSHVALDDVTFDIDEGEVFGYLGPNGAGKTTTIRMLLGLLRPTAGRIEVFGLDAWRQSTAVQVRTGYVPGDPGFWDRMTGAEFIRYLVRLRGELTQFAAATSLAERLDLDLGRPVRALSRGNRQKLAIVQAFMGRPELLVLDEPTSGLDPLIQREFHALVREATERGGTVLLSSHLLDDVQRVADRVGIIRAGRLVAVERLEELRANALHHVVARFDGPVDTTGFMRIDGLRDVAFTAGVLDCRVPERSLDAVIKVLARHRLRDVMIREPDLEEMFLAYYGEPDASAA